MENMQEMLSARADFARWLLGLTPCALALSTAGCSGTVEPSQEKPSLAEEIAAAEAHHLRPRSVARSHVLPLQPFLTAFNRYEEHVIAFLVDHPRYQAIEAMVDRHSGDAPRVRAIINLHDGSQIDHFNDPAIARDAAAILSGRQVVYRPIRFETVRVDGLPSVRLQFTSYRGEDVDLLFRARGMPEMGLGGFIDPGAHASGSSLPVMWAGASAHEEESSAIRIDQARYHLGLGPSPDHPGGIYSTDFHIGVLRRGHLELRLLARPRDLEPGELWLYQDRQGELHSYEIVEVQGERYTLRRTTTSALMTEEILETELVEGGLELRSIRSTGRASIEGPASMTFEGLTLDLTTPGRFSLSLDEHRGLIVGDATRESTDARIGWHLKPTAPRWAASRSVNAEVVRHRLTYAVESEVGHP
ncbi:hypothetical protein [Chondromyces crocatus]|uniref:Uncharacterized protein n=1 Tax=Chondromyces crocatus TaxID=52 RepID=A0A0K1EAI2_CHOCO|nr:hypothetical protein [Chondromyces crocatus]AKT37682.1 uncharacterized protein CMC5_018240 [Chondromyces crocatus]